MLLFVGAMLCSLRQQCDHFLFHGGSAAIYADNTTICGSNAITYGSNAISYGSNAAIDDSNATIYDSNTAIFGSDAAIFGGGTDENGVAQVGPAGPVHERALRARVPLQPRLPQSGIGSYA